MVYLKSRVIIHVSELNNNLYFLNVELNSLSKNDLARVVEARSGPSHVLLPRIRTGLATPTGCFVSAESTTDLGTIGRCVQINNTGIGTSWALELVPRLDIIRENGGGET